jgi:MoaA/NifB/PqqE/SkfB family radical SAM enzyme
VKAKLIDDIELAHDHRPATKKSDKIAVMHRYNIRNIEKSYKRIADKHGIILKDHGKIGTVYNLEYMLNTYNPFSSYFWKRFIPIPIKRSLKNFEARMRRRAVPTFCNLFMTDRCNFRCPWCRRQVVGINESKEMTLPTVQRLLSLYPSINRFCIAGLGEPTLCAQFVEIINFLKRNKKTVGIITNGTDISKFQALDDEPEYISISLYGYNNESYQKYTGIRLFDRVIENFKKIKHKFNNVGFSYIVHKENFHDLDQLLKICDTLMPDFLDLHNYLAYDPNNQEEISKIITTHDREMIDYINAVCKGKRYRVNKPAIIDLDNPKFKCKSYNFLINLDGDGNIGGCQRHIPPHQTFGNIFNDDDPYNSSEMIRHRKKIHKKSYIHSECTFCFGNFCEQ